MLMGDKCLVWVGPGSVGTEYAILRNENLLFYKLQMCPVQWRVLHLQYVLPYIIQTALFLCQGASVWIPDPDAVWVSALLLQDYSPGKKHLPLQLTNGKVGQAGSPHYKEQCQSPQQELLTSFSICRRSSTQWGPPLTSHRWGTPTSWRGRMI